MRDIIECNLLSFITEPNGILFLFGEIFVIEFDYASSLGLLF